MRPLRSSRSRGFTLVEALVALVLATLLFGGIALYTGTWLRSWGSIVERGARQDTVAVVLDRMVEDLESAQPIYTNGALTGGVVFEGEADRISFVRPALGYGPRAGLDDVTYHNGQVGRELAVVRSRRGFPPAGGGGEDLPLIVGDARLSFAYATGTGELESRWKHTDRLPSVVRITLSCTSPLPWSQSTLARPRAEVPASCGAKDQYAECAAALDARKP